MDLEESNSETTIEERIESLEKRCEELERRGAQSRRVFFLTVIAIYAVFAADHHALGRPLHVAW